MAVSFTLNVDGDFAAAMRDEEKRLALAVTLGMGLGARATEKDWEAAAASAGLGPLARAPASQVYPDPKRGLSLRPAALIYVKGATRTKGAMESHAVGSVIVPRRGKFLMVPIGEGLRLRQQFGRRMTPETIPDRYKPLVFVARPGRNPILVASPQRARQGQRGGFSVPSPRALRTGRDLATVVLFELVPVVTQRAKFDLGAIERQGAARIPGLIETAHDNLARKAD